MRFLMILVTVLAGLYGGYWFVGRAAVENGADRFLQSLVSDGWTVSHGDLATTGFPSRFDTTITDLSLTHPGNGITWATPMFQVFALSYRPTQVIALWPERQVVTLPGERLTITADDLRASAGVNVALSLPLDAITLESGPMVIESDRGYQVALDRLVLAFRGAGPGPADYDLSFDGTGLLPPAGLTAMIDPAGTLPAAVDLLKVDSQVTLNQPIDRNMQQQPQVQAVTFREVRMNWGNIEVTGTGSLTFAPDGTPDGSIQLAARNWEQVISLAVAAGIVPAGIAPLLQRAGALLAQGSDQLAAPLTFKDGLMSLGPIPLGPAPRFN